MEVKTYRAKSMRDALAMIRRELGPDAAVLHTRQLGGGLLGWLRGRHIEVTASADVHVPSRVTPGQDADQSFPAARHAPAQPRLTADDYRTRYRDDLKGKLDDLCSMVEDLCRTSRKTPGREMPESLFKLFTDLIEAEVSEELARELVQRVQRESPGDEIDDLMLAKARIARLIEDEIAATGPIRATPGKRRLVALVGPTGVGKTTTIAKLAANYRLRERCRVGLITVDTYRIAAVDQIRTYADIMDLPMEVVSTPREMRNAAARLEDMDLVFMDTAGRSPKDELKIQELKSMLAEAQADEVHLVLSATGGTSSLIQTARQFAAVRTTALVLTKLDEASGLGNLIPLLRDSKLPLSYVTDGQNVPDDIQVADSRQLAKIVLGSSNE
jgi:flagellar biosynthesis protein FlhF